MHSSYLLAHASAGLVLNGSGSCAEISTFRTLLSSLVHSCHRYPPYPAYWGCRKVRDRPLLPGNSKHRVADIDRGIMMY